MSARDEDEWEAKSNGGRSKRDEGHEIDIVVGGRGGGRVMQVQEQKNSQPIACLLVYRAPRKVWSEVARMSFLLLPHCPACPCMVPA